MCKTKPQLPVGFPMEPRGDLGGDSANRALSTLSLSELKLCIKWRNSPASRGFELKKKSAEFVETSEAFLFCLTSQQT